MPRTAKLPLDLVYGNPNQPRKIFEPTALAELAASIVEQGLAQAITVRADNAGRYMIVMGERRYRAHVLASLPTVDAIVYEHDEMTDDELADKAIVENLQRKDVTPLEEARAFQARLDTGISVADLAKRLGMSQAWRITERTSLLNLRDEYQALFAKGQLSNAQAFEMSRLSPKLQDVLFREIRSGRAPTYNAMRAISTRLLEEQSQSSMFDDVAPIAKTLPAPATDEELQAVTSLERKIAAVGDLIAAGFDQNEVIAAKRVNPSNAAKMAEHLRLMQTHLLQIDKALRSAAVQLDLVA